MDGEVIIKVSADTKNFDKKLLELEGKYKNKEADIKFSEYNLKQEEASLRELNAQYERQKAYQDEINQKLEKEKALLESIRSTPRDFRTPEGRREDFNLRAQETTVSGRISSLETQQSAITRKLLQQYDLMDQQELKVNKINARYEKQKNDLEIIEAKMQDINNQASKTSISLDKSSGSTDKTLKSMTRWGLAIFGVRSAYMGIRQIMNGVFAQNTKLGDQMDAMKKSIAGAFTPIVEKIINLIRTLMAYINYLWKGLFGKNLFSEKVEKNLKSGAKSAKEIKNQLAGFDEANVLSSDSSSGGGAGGGGTTDLKLADVPIPGWLKWIREFIEKHPTISKIIFGIAAFTLFGGWKIAGGIFGTISKLLGKKGAGAAASGASGLLGVLGTMLLIAATVVICKITYDKVKEAWQAYKDLKKAIDESNQTTEKSMEMSKKKVSQILEETKSLDKEDEQHKRNIDTVYKMIDINDDYAHRTFNNRKNQEIAEKGYQEILGQSVTELDNMRRAGEMTDEELYDYYKFLRTYLTPEQINNAEQLGLTAEEAYNLRNGFKELDKKFTTKYDVDAQQAKDKFDTFISNVKKGLSKPIEFNLKANITGLSDKVKNALKTLGVFHADGGIVNLPGRGVPITHYAGEAGREGIIPMDNESQMALLGSEIAKRVTINLTNVTEIDGRTIARKVQEVNNGTNFLLNR